MFSPFCERMTRAEVSGQPCVFCIYDFVICVYVFLCLCVSIFQYFCVSVFLCFCVLCSVFCISVFLCFNISVFLCFCVFSVLWKDDRDGSQRSAERLSNHFLWSIPALSTLHQYLLFSDDQRSMQYYGDNQNHPLILIMIIAWKEQIIWMAIGHIIVEKLILD